MNRLSNLHSKLAAVARSGKALSPVEAIKICEFANAGPEPRIARTGECIVRALHAPGFTGMAGLSFMLGPPQALFFMFPDDDQPGRDEIHTAFGEPEQTANAKNGAGYHASYGADGMKCGFNIEAATSKSPVMSLSFHQAAANVDD